MRVQGRIPICEELDAATPEEAVAVFLALHPGATVERVDAREVVGRCAVCAAGILAGQAHYKWLGGQMSCARHEPRHAEYVPATGKD